MRRELIAIPLLLTLYAFSVVSLSGYMKSKPFVEKLGYIPTVNSLKVAALDHRQFVGASMIMKVLMYYGGLVDKADNRMRIPADYPAMSRMIHAAVRLDPYNMDAYYFAQAILTWDVGQTKIANDLLLHGMKYRDWDWYLPFYVGFNYGYFLKDYPNAAKYYQRAGELSGEQLFMTLAGRYLHISGLTDMAIAYLDAMERQSRNNAVKSSLEMRKQAFIAVRAIEQARDRFVRERSHPPASVDELVSRGYLKNIPQDPYGGQFYITGDGKVTTSSDFTSARPANKPVE